MEKINWKRLALTTLIVGLMPLILYANTLWMGLVFNDTLTLNGAIGSGQPPSLLDWLRQPFMQPWVRASFLTDMSNYRDGFGWYHFVNVWLHLSSAAALSVLVYIVLRRCHPEILQRRPEYLYVLPALAGLIFACHPLAAQSATYISARSSVLAGANFLLALITFSLLPFTRGPAFVASAVMAVLFSLMTLASGEIGLLLAPSMVALYLLLRPSREKIVDWIVDHPVVFAAAVAASFLVPFYLFAGTASAGVPNNFGFPVLDAPAYYATQFKALLTYYTRVFVVPFGLSIDPPYSIAAGFADPLVLGGCVLFALTIFALYKMRLHAVIFLALWLFLCGFVAHGLIPQVEAVADQAFYLPLAGLSLLAAWYLLEIFPGTMKSELPKLVAILVVLSGLSVLRNLNFSQDSTLAAATLSTNPQSRLGNALKAQELTKKGEWAEVVKVTESVISNPADRAIFLLLGGQAQLHLGEARAASETLQKAVSAAQAQRLPIEGAARYALAEALVTQDLVDEAERMARTAFAVEPQNPRAIYVVGLMGLKRKNYPMAMEYLKKSMEQGVDDAALPLIRAMLGAGAYKEAQAMALVYVNRHDTPMAQLLLGNAAVGTGDVKLAEDSLKKALQARRDDAESMALLSIVYQRKGDNVLAESYHMDAVKRNPKIFSELLLPATQPSLAGAQTAKASPVPEKTSGGRDHGNLSGYR